MAEQDITSYLAQVFKRYLSSQQSVSIAIKHPDIFKDCDCEFR